MQRLRTVSRAAILAAGVLLSGGAFAAAPADDAGLEAARPAPHPDLPFGAEMLVHDWVLCISRGVAEELARALGESPAAGEAAFAQLVASRSCGRFEELRVILDEAVFGGGRHGGATVFSARVGIGDAWASGFVVRSPGQPR